MYVVILLMVLGFAAGLILAKKAQNKIVSEQSPFSFAQDILILNTGTGFSIPGANIDRVHLQYNPKALQNRFYDMKIIIVKADGSRKVAQYRGSGNGARPQDMAAALQAHNIRCLDGE